MHSQPKGGNIYRNIWNSSDENVAGIGGHLAQTGGVPDHHHDQGDPHQEPQVSKQGIFSNSFQFFFSLLHDCRKTIRPSNIQWNR